MSANITLISIESIIEEIENEFMKYIRRLKKPLCPLTKSRMSLKGQTENTKKISGRSIFGCKNY